MSDLCDLCAFFRHSAELDLVARRQGRIERGDLGAKMVDGGFGLNSRAHVGLNGQGRQTVPPSDEGELLAVLD